MFKNPNVGCFAAFFAMGFLAPLVLPYALNFVLGFWGIAIISTSFVTSADGAPIAMNGNLAMLLTLLVFGFVAGIFGMALGLVVRGLRGR